MWKRLEDGEGGERDVASCLLGSTLGEEPVREEGMGDVGVEREVSSFLLCIVVPSRMEEEKECRGGWMRRDGECGLVPFECTLGEEWVRKEWDGGRSR